MNRSKQQGLRKRCAFRKNGGGYGLGAPLMPLSIPADDWTYAQKVPIHQEFSDCAFPGRPGQLESHANPSLAQTPMAGGACGCSVQRGGCGCGSLFGGKRNKRNKRNTRKQRGGNRGVMVDPSMSVGGNGPNAAPTHTPLPCDVRAGSPNPVFTGGAYSTGNAYPAECYRAPGSSLPVYNADSAGFHFEPSTGTMPDGVTPYNDVIQHAARVGGKQKKERKSHKAHKAHKRTRRNRK